MKIIQIKIERRRLICTEILLTTRRRELLGWRDNDGKLRLSGEILTLIDAGGSAVPHEWSNVVVNLHKHAIKIYRWQDRKRCRYGSDTNL